MHGVTLRMSLCSASLYTLIVLVGCRSAVPDRSLQADLQPSTAPNEGIFSSIAKRFQAEPNRQQRPTATSAATSRRRPAPSDDDVSSTQTEIDEADGLIEAFKNADPEVQAAARQQLAAMRNMQRAQANAKMLEEPTSEVASSATPTPASEMSLPKPTQSEPVAHAVAMTAGQSPETSSPIQQATASVSEQESRAAVAFASQPTADAKPAADLQQVAAASEPVEPETKTIELESESPAKTAAPVAAGMTSKQHLESLIKVYEEKDISLETPEGLTELAKLRMLYLLADKPDQAMEKVEDLTAAEQDYLRYQMMTMWNMVDPDGSPSRTRRWEKSLENLRLASGHLAAATESLDVRGIAFCTEVESYGRITPFKDYKLEPGQQVILYCEIDNFAAERLSDGYETHFQGSYDLFNAEGVRVAEQVLPADKQSCNNFRRDYFIAYRLYLPKQLAPGPHRIQLTIEDLKGKKYGQSTLDFEIVAKKPAPAQ